VDAGLVIGPGTTMIGGLERDTWAPAGLGRRSVLRPSAYFKARGTLLSAASGAVTLSGIELRDDAGRAATLLGLAGTALAARDVSFAVGGEGTRAALSAVAAPANIADSSFSAEQAGSASLVAVTGGSMTLTGGTLSGPRESSEFACIVAADGARLDVAGSRLDPGSGQKVRAIRAVASMLVLQNASLASGAGDVEAAAVDIRGGSITASGCDFSTDVDAVAPVGLRSQAASVTGEGGRMRIAGRTGAAGIAVSGGTLAIRASRIEGGTAAEFLYLIRADGADGGLEGCVLAGGETGDLVDVLARDCRLEVRATTIVTGEGSVSATALSAHGPAAVTVTATILATMRPSIGPAILVLRQAKGVPPELAIRSCCFGGWERLLGFDPVSGVRDVATVDALNGLDGDPLGGTLDGCIVEEPSAIFAGAADYRVSSGSRCAAAGIGAPTTGE